jgi:hypothetical protein
METGERIEVKNNRNQSSPAVVAPFPISFTQTGCVALELLFKLKSTDTSVVMSFSAKYNHGLSH